MIFLTRHQLMPVQRIPASLLTLVLLLIHCAPVNKMSYSNLAYLYNPEQLDLHMDCMPYHSSDESTEFFFSFSLDDLLFEKESDKDDYLANFNVHFELFDFYNTRMLIDSGTRIYPDLVRNEPDRPFISSFPLKTRYPDKFVLNLTLTDMNRKHAYSTYSEILKSSVNSRQNFLLSDETGTLLFQPYLERDQEFRLMFNNPETPELFVHYYHRDFPIAGPPFLVADSVPFSHEPDSLFRVKLLRGETDLLRLKEEGIYLFRADTTLKEGFTLLRLHEGYPRIIHSVQMSYPLRYLTTRREYEKIETHPDTRQAVEDFWLKNAGNPDRAARMIKLYYTRVEQANRLFTSYQEGWKTDRGMIYIIYGDPTVVYRQQDTEQWIYGKEGNILSISFSFIRVNNPFTDNDFELERSADYKESWYIAVESWRR
ncbi:MAG: GWxTD domain-containing protein [Lentimicrobiaceae bacterium]|nr:GWxTD domain-containing protein [Lentimicrobiaceae bacterium]